MVLSNINWSLLHCAVLLGTAPSLFSLSPSLLYLPLFFPLTLVLTSVTTAQTDDWENPAMNPFESLFFSSFISPHIPPFFKSPVCLFLARVYLCAQHYLVSPYWLLIGVFLLVACDKWMAWELLPVERLCQCVYVSKEEVTRGNTGTRPLIGG